MGSRRPDTGGYERVVWSGLPSGPRLIGKLQSTITQTGLWFTLGLELPSATRVQMVLSCLCTAVSAICFVSEVRRGLTLAPGGRELRRHQWPTNTGRRWAPLVGGGSCHAQRISAGVSEGGCLNIVVSRNGCLPVKRADPEVHK